MIELDIYKSLQGSAGEMELKIKLSVKEHDFVALAGESGSGKTSLLRILAGLESARGEISVSGELWLSDAESLPVQQRKIGFVFQDYALFPNMSVEQNLLYVAKEKALAKHLLELTELYALKDRLPHTLSGGQKQRVALCRALMAKPKLLLMDEPLSALDPQMRARLQHDIVKLHREFGTTTIMVSHDPAEIYRLAKRVIVLEQGKIIQDATAKEVFLKTRGSQKFSLRGELLEIIKADVIYIAIVAIGQQIVEIVLDAEEAKSFTVGDSVEVNTKAFSPTLRYNK
jgi:molybdate transport system ATP-binding protein